jgi:hypothetical protein
MNADTHLDMSRAALLSFVEGCRASARERARTKNEARRAPTLTGQSLERNASNAQCFLNT